MAKTPEEITDDIIFGHYDDNGEPAHANALLDTALVEQPLDGETIRELMIEAAKQAQTPVDITRYGVHPDGTPRVKPRYYGHGRTEQNGEWRRTVPTVMDRDDGSLVAQVVSAEVRDLIVDSLNAGIASALDFKPENESDAFREEWDRLKDEPSFTLRVKGQDPDFSHIATYSDWLNITSEQARRILAMLSEEAVA